MSTHPFTFRGRRRARGVAIVYGVLVLLALIAMCSLAVDYGRAQLVRSELQACADGAARAAASGISTSLADARQRARDLAALNRANGAAITFADADFHFGKWNPATETIDAASGSDIDAVEVTARCTVPLAFGAAFGKSTTAVAARATARCGSDPSPGIIGLNSIQMQNGAMTDSYRSADAAYAFATHRTNGDIASNGSIQLTDTSQVYGDAHRLSGQTVNSVSRIVSPGQVITMSTPLSYAVPTIPPGTTNLGDYTRQGTGSTTLTAGNYRATKFEIKDQHKLTISGVVTVYVNGDVTFQNQAKTMGNPPGNFRIRVVSTGHTLKIQDDASVEADIAAPGVNVTLQNQAQLYGSVVGKTLIIQDQAQAHFDESIVSGSGSTSTTLVR